jgi:FKBP-type peptidyl-prolyl cis-trans isomerase FkpA
MFRVKKIPIIIIVVFLLMACSGSDTSIQKENPKNAGEQLIRANEKLVKTESEQIEDYINRYGWKMQETGTGLRYMIYLNGNGVKAEAGKFARINYTVSLLTGELVYSSDKLGVREFVIGKGQIESGIDEGILFLKTGDRAKFILPSHLAFGLVGDGSNIPAKAVLVYDLELLEIK